MNNSTDTQRVIKLRFLPCDFSNFWSRLTHYGLTVTNRGNQLVHVTIEIANDGYELLIDHGISNYDVSPAMDRFVDMKGGVTVTLIPKHESSYFVVRDNMDRMIEEGRDLDPHGLIDWVYGYEDDSYLCTDFIREVLEINHINRPIKTPIELYRWLWENDNEVIGCGSGIYGVHVKISNKLEF